MRTISIYIFFTFLILGITHAQMSSAQKVLVSVTDDWGSNKATMYLFDKTSEGWKKHRLVFSVSIGRNGLGWGEGVHPKQNGEYVKKEGDDRSPAGVFELDTLFYGLSEKAPDGVRYPYLPLTKLTRCVDDEKSTVYNSIVEEDSLKKDWNSAERMGAVDPDYKYVLVVKHNPQREPGKGSCIFIHTVNVPTSGCTSMDEEDMLTLLRWLDPKKKTVIVQLPHSEYHRLRSEWNMPKLLNN
ncbi:MAG: L,D-transpeptidase family protein [Bacteroidota bacterium]|nr:L,D-transpeptidase family protein [Bacteroidota bacterium]